MIKSEKIQINEKTFQIKELTIRQILDLKSNFGTDASMPQLLEKLLEATSNIKKEDMLDFSFSDIQNLIECVKRVNGSFFEIPKVLGLENAATTIQKEIVEAITRDLAKAFMPVK